MGLCRSILDPPVISMHSLCGGAYGGGVVYEITRRSLRLIRRVLSVVIRRTVHASMLPSDETDIHMRQRLG